MSSGARLLVVDDEASIRDMLAFFFHKRGFEVLTASSFAEGVAAAGRLTPDIVLSDIKMPDGNGLDLLRQIRESVPSCEVILMTGFAAQRERASGLDAIVHDVVTKPFSVADIRSAVAGALAARKKR